MVFIVVFKYLLDFGLFAYLGLNIDIFRDIDHFQLETLN